MDERIRVGITHGDINGIGYEVILKALAEEEITDLFTPIVFGVPDIAQKAIEKFGIENLNLNIIEDAGEARQGRVNLVALQNVKPELKPGTIAPDAGESAVEALERGVDALKNGDIDVLVTAPISKEAVQSERFKFPGHTEFLEHKTGGDSSALMILCNENLRVALLTIHMPLSKVSENITKDKIIGSVERFASTLKKDFGIVKPSIAVMSLNPHSGDGGMLGEEEEKEIKPALAELQEKGFLAFGPFAADGFFGHSLYKNFDGVLAMYHDQGLAPFKTIATSGGVNFTAGLPYVRTSPDHGTAFDIAWQGVADPRSMRDAIYMAIDIFRRRKRFEDASSNPLKKHVHERPEKGENFDRGLRHNDSKPEHND